MTFGEIQSEVFDRADSVEGIESMAVNEFINTAHRRLHQWFLFDESIADESISWTAANGVTKDVTSELTRWRGLPVDMGVVGANDTFPWAQVQIQDIYKRRNMTITDTRHLGRFAFGVRDTEMMIVSAFGSTTAVTVAHYQSPAELAATSDTPTFPSEFHDILVDMALQRVFAKVRQVVPSATAKRMADQEVAEADGRFTAIYNKLVKRVNETSGGGTIQPGPLWQGMYEQQRRRRYRRHRSGR